MGFGKIIHDDEDNYVEYWDEFQAHGLGVYHTKKVISYEGYFEHYKQIWFGIEKWFWDTGYYGDYKDGNKDRYDVLDIEEKGVYERQMKDRNINGTGTFVFKDNRK